MLRPLHRRLILLQEKREMALEGIFDLLTDAPFGAYAASLDQTILFWNQSARRILGYSPDEVLGRRSYEIAAGTAPEGLFPSHRDGCPSIRRLRDGLVPHRVQTRMRCASGETKLVSLTPMVIAGTTDDAPILVHLFRDAVVVNGSEGDDDADWVRRSTSGTGTDIVSDHPTAYAVPEVSPMLTAREREVLGLVSLGWATPRIAEELNISPHTVLNHIRHFRRKLSAPTKLDAVVTAIRLGILPID